MGLPVIPDDFDCSVEVKGFVVKFMPCSRDYYSAHIICVHDSEFVEVLHYGRNGCRGTFVVIPFFPPQITVVTDE